MKFFLLVLTTYFSFLNLNCQTDEQREVIRSQMSKEDSIKSSEAVKKYYSSKKERIEKYLKKYPKTPIRYKKNGKLYLLSDISSEGKPLYITQKTKTKKCIK